MDREKRRSLEPTTFWHLRLGESLKSDLNDQGVYSAIRRNEATADFSMSDSHQAVETISLVYTFLGSPGFGAVEWRDTDRSRA